MRNDNDDYSSEYEDAAPEEVAEAPAALATPSDDQILAFVQANIDNPALIAETAAHYGVSVADLSRVTGYGEDAVTSYFENNNVSAPVYTPPTVTPTPVTPTPVTPTPVVEEVEAETPAQAMARIQAELDEKKRIAAENLNTRQVNQTTVETPKQPQQLPEDLYSSWAQDQVGNPYTKQVVGPRTTFRQNADGTLTELDERGDPIKAAETTSGLSAVSTLPAVTADTTPVGALTTIQNNTTTETTPTSGLATVGAAADKTASAAPVGGLTQAAPVTSTVNMSGKDYVVDNSVVDTLTQQIIAQGNTSKWKGEGFGSPEANAKAMAQHLAASGIKDIKDVGMITVPADVQLTPITELVMGDTLDSNGYPTQGYVPTIVGYTDDKGNRVDPSKVSARSDYSGGDAGDYVTTYTAPVGTQQVIGSKTTGKPLLSDYAERTGAGGKAFSGTYAGEGNTAFNVNFDSKGNPIFYTTGASSNDVAKFMEDIGPLGQIALAVATGGLSIPEQLAAKFAISVLSGQDIGDALKSAATSYASSFIPGLDFIQDGASYLTDLDSTGILSKAFTGAAVGGTKALLSGQDLGDAVLAGAASGGASGAATTLLGNIEGFDDLSKSQQTTIRNLVTGTLTGKPITTTLLNAVIDTATTEVGRAIDSTVTGLTDNNTLDSSAIDKVTSKLNVDGDDDDEDDDSGVLGTTKAADVAGKDSLTNNAAVGAVTSVLKSTLTGAAKTATKGAITSAVTGKKMASMPSVSKQLTGNALSAIQRAVPTKVDISKLIPTTTAKKAPPKKVDVAQLKAMTPVSGLSAIKKG